MLRNLLIDVRLFSPRPTGISVYIEELHFKNLNHYLQYYDRIIILHNRKNKKDLTITIKDSRIEYLYTKLSPFNPFHILILSVQLFKFHGTAIWPIYSSTFFKWNRKDVIMVHDLMYKYVPFFLSKNIFINWLKKSILDIIVNVAIRNGEIILANSNDTAIAVNSWTGKMPLVHPLGVRPLSSNINYHFELEGYFLYVGGSRPHKNLDWMVDVFLNSKSDRIMVIAGLGHDRFKCKSDRIIVVDSPKDEMLSELYKNSKYVIAPSLYEGFGLPILEGLNYGKSVLASRRGALIEFESFGVNYFDPVCPDELMAYFNNEASIVQKSDIDLSDFSWQSYRRIFKKIIK